jgi:hypothetical protein
VGSIRTRQRVPRAQEPSPRPELVTDRSSRPSFGRAPPRPNGPQTLAYRVPSPPISHASGALPRSDGPGSTPSVETTVERPLLGKEGFQDAAYLQLADCRTDWPIGNQIHIALRHPQQRSKALCEVDLLSGSKARTRSPRFKSQATFPIPSGHILTGRRINRSDPGRPAVPQASSAGAGSPCGRSLRRSSQRSQHPKSQFTIPPSGPPALTTASLQGGNLSMSGKPFGIPFQSPTREGQGPVLFPLPFGSARIGRSAPQQRFPDWQP